MAELRKGTVYEHFRSAWPVLLALGLGLFWLGHSILTPTEIDDRVSTILRPLQDKQEWIGEELQQHEYNGGHPRIVEKMRALEERIRELEK